MPPSPSLDDPLATEMHQLRRRIAELEQRLSQQPACNVPDRYRTLFLQSVEAMVFLDAQGQYLEQNPTHARLLEYADEDLCGHTPALSIGQPAFAAISRRLAETGTFRGEVLARTKTGRTVFLDVSMWSIMDQHGVAAGAIGVFRDHTERRTEQDGQRQFVQRVMEAVPDHISIVGPDYRYRRVNHAYPHMHGVPEEQILGAHVADILGQDTFANLVKPQLDRCFGGEEVAYEAWFTFRSIGPKYMAVRYSPLRGPDRSVEAAAVISRDITAAKEAEQDLRRANRELEARVFERTKSLEAANAALRLGEERLRTLYEDMPSMYFTVDHTGSVLSVNRFGAHQLGFEPHELIGGSVLQVFPPDQQEPAGHALERAFQAPHEIHHWKLRKLRKDGTELWVEETVRVITDGDGAPVALIDCRDVTELELAEAERRRAVEQLRNTSDQLETLVRLSPLAIVSLNEQGQVIRWNPAAERMLGWSEQEVLGRDLPYVPPGLEREADALWENGLAGLIQPGIELRRQRKDGRLIDLSLWPAVSRDQHGRITSIFGILEEITSRKEAEASLRKQRAFLRQVIDISPNFVLAKDRDGRFTLANQAVADAYGTTAEALIGKTDADLSVNRDEVAHFRDMDLRVFDTGAEIFIREEPLTDSTGKIRWLQTVKRPLVNEQGIADQVLVIATDITQRRASEQALRRSEEHLRLALEERERLSQDLHDGILQSLYGIGLGLDTAGRLMNSAPRKAKREFAHSISQLNRTIEEVRQFITGLHFNSLEGDRFQEALKSVVGIYGSSRQTQFLVQVSPKAVEPLTPQQRLHLLNLAREAVSNSIRHGRAREVRVGLRRHRGGIRLEIRDNGSGFDPGKAGTSGFGLNNMAARAVKMGGRFHVQSCEGGGTRVLIDLPRGGSHE